MKAKLDEGLLKSLLVLGSIIEARDSYTGGHTWRVAHYSKLLAEKAGLSEFETYLASLGGFVHDLGKIGIPDQILNKPAALTNEEFAIMKTHPQIGRTLLVDHPLAHLVFDAVTLHHERCDRKGYPEGREKSELSIYARIVAVADAFDAMTSTRKYRAGMPKSIGLSILEEERGKQFDGELVTSFVELSEVGKLDHIIGHSDESTPLVTCPVCGPIIAVPRKKKDGDIIHCNSCKGKFQLHAEDDTFSLEFKNERLFTAEPEICKEQIGEFVKKKPF